MRRMGARVSQRIVANEKMQIAILDMPAKRAGATERPSMILDRTHQAFFGQGSWCQSRQNFHCEQNEQVNGQPLAMFGMATRLPKGM